MKKKSFDLVHEVCGDSKTVRFYKNYLNRQKRRKTKQILKKLDIDFGIESYLYSLEKLTSAWNIL